MSADRRLLCTVVDHKCPRKINLLIWWSNHLNIPSFYSRTCCVAAYGDGNGNGVGEPCHNKAKVGAVVQLQGRLAKDFYIVPMCNGHANRHNVGHPYFLHSDTFPTTCPCDGRELPVLGGGNSSDFCVCF
jgi:hypothetical protein